MQHTIPSDAKEREITSPWLNAKVYYRDGEPVGGVFIILDSQYIKLRDLVFSFKQEWESLVNVPTNTANEVSISKENARIFREQFYEKFPDASGINQNAFRELFESRGEQELVMAYLYGSSKMYEYYNSEAQLNKCIQKAAPFYFKLYSLLFHLALSGERLKTSQNKYYEFLPLDGDAIKKASSNINEYNCFYDGRLNTKGME